MKIIYNLEEFAINEMFLPYQNLIVNYDNLPEDEFERAKEKQKRIKDVEKEIRKDLMGYLYALNKNKKAFDCVFQRLANLDFKFYKWLYHPFVNEVTFITKHYKEKMLSENTISR